VHGGDVVVAQAEAGHGPCPGVLGDHVEAGREAQHQVPPLGRLEVDAHAALAEVVAEERGADLAAVGVGHRRERPATEVPALGVLDLHHLGPEAAEELRGVREGLHLLEGEHAHAVERLARPRRTGVGDVPEAHAATVLGDVTTRQIPP
jgi:hypothetical protein